MEWANRFTCTLCHATCNPQEGEPDRVNRVMRFLSLRAAIIVIGTIVVLAVPPALGLGHTKATSTGGARPSTVESLRHHADPQAKIACGVSRAPSVLTPTDP